MYNAKIKNIEDKITDVANLETKTTPNAKINEIKGEIPNITKLATTILENKTPNITNFKKTDYNTTISETEQKIVYIANVSVFP